MTTIETPRDDNENPAILGQNQDTGKAVPIKATSNGSMKTSQENAYNEVNDTQKVERAGSGIF